MNERIKLLAKQAEIKWQHQEDAIYSTMTLEQFEKVAELIVRECAQIGEDVDGNQTTKNEILKHFGVEE